MRRALPLALALVLAAGCGSSGGAKITSKRLSARVLQQGDLPTGFTEFTNSRQATVDTHPGPRADPKRFGRIDGWIARFKRGGTAETRGALVVESRVDLFPSASAAKKDLSAYEGELTATVANFAGRRLPDPAIGAAARAYAYRQGSVRFYLVAWREANATASVLAEGFSLGPEVAISLARAQEHRLAP